MEERLSYAPDSPLFCSRLHQYGSDLEKLGEFLKTLVRQMRQFCKESKQCAKSAETLGLHMCNGLGASESHMQLLPVIMKFGDIFSEIAASQDILAESLERTFAQPLENFYKHSIASVHTMTQQYHSIRDAGDLVVGKYLQSDVSNFGRGVNTNQLESRAYDIVLHKKRFETLRFDLVNKINEIEARKSFEVAESCVSGVYALRTHHRVCMDKLQSCEAFMSELQQRQQQERASFLDALVPIERKRRDVMTVLEAMVERVEIACPYLSVPDEQGAKSPTPDMMAAPSEESPTSSNTSASSSFQSLSRMGVTWGANLIGGFKQASKSSVLSTDTSGTSGTSSRHVPDSRRRATSLLSAPHMMSTPSSVGGGGEDAAAVAALTSGREMLSCEDCEVRMKALDTSELSSLFTINIEESPAGVIRQGYLWKRNDKQKLLEQWKRRWFVLDETKLYYIEEEGSHGKYHVQTVCDIMLASVRERKTEYDMPFCFEIAFANVESTVVQAEGQKDFLLWISALRSTIEKRLFSGDAETFVSAQMPKKASKLADIQKASGRLSFGGPVDSSAPVPAAVSHATVSSHQARRLKNAPLVADILARNQYCAECTREAPEWVSLNLGCAVCIDCSGVHRSMGVHISKMRSLNLDDLEEEEYNLLAAIGNDISNSVWEAVDLKPWKKPEPSSTYSQREEFIRAKYDKRLFLNPPVDENTQSEEDIDMWCTALMVAVEKDNIVGALTALAHGALACFVPSEVVCHPDLKRFPLHAAARSGSFLCMVLLVMNGADIAERNEDGFNAAELASQNCHDDIELFLVRRLEIMMSRGNKSTGRPDGIASFPSTDSHAARLEVSDSHDLTLAAEHDSIAVCGEFNRAVDENAFGEFEEYVRSAETLNAIPEENMPSSAQSKKESKQ